MPNFPLQIEPISDFIYVAGFYDLMPSRTLQPLPIFFSSAATSIKCFASEITIAFYRATLAGEKYSQPPQRCFKRLGESGKPLLYSPYSQT